MVRSLRSIPQTSIWDVIYAQIERSVERSVELRRGLAVLADASLFHTTRNRRTGSTPSSSCAPTSSSAAFSSSATSSAAYKACVALERLPLLAPEPPAFEQAYRAWSDAWNAKRFKQLPSSFVETEASSGGSSSTDGNQQGGGASTAWVAAPRTTAADRAKDFRSLNRRLDERLFLLVKRPGTGWGFVEGELDAGSAQSSRAVAEEALAELVGSGEVQDEGDQGQEGPGPAKRDLGDAFYFVGNSPAAHSEDVDKAMRFYHRCQLVRHDAFRGDQMIARGGFEDYVWVTVDEMGSYLEDTARVEVLQSMA